MGGSHVSFLPPQSTRRHVAPAASTQVAVEPLFTSLQLHSIFFRSRRYTLHNHPPTKQQILSIPINLQSFIMGQMIPDLALRPANRETRANSQRSKRLQYDPYFTEKVIAATGPNAHPRLAQVMPSLVRHLHDFAREVNLTVAEWSAAVDMVCHPFFFFLGPLIIIWLLTLN